MESLFGKRCVEARADSKSSSRPISPSAFRKIPYLRSSSRFSYELVLYETSGLKNGTMSNVSWLQEFPDPVTKICWDNYLCVSPADALKEN